MDYLRYSTVEETVPPKVFLKEKVLGHNFTIYECEGVARTRTGNFAIFERVEIDSRDEIELDILFKDIIKLISERNDLNILDWYECLAKKKIDIYLIVHDTKCQHFVVASFDTGVRRFEPKRSVKNCQELSEFIYQITNKRPNKEFKYVNKMKCIDKCLREHNVSHPGNIDGIIVEKGGRYPVPRVLLEFSKVCYTTLDKHRVRYKREYEQEDSNRWNILWQLSNFLGVPVGIIWWRPESTAEAEFIMIGKLVEENRKTTPKFGPKIRKDDIQSVNDLLDLLRRI